jgi:REP element-mobilizing transposase RayT
MGLIFIIVNSLFYNRTLDKKSTYLLTVLFLSKRLEIHAWCVMSNHVHLVFRSINGQNQNY